MEFMAKLTVDGAELEATQKETVLKGKLSQINDIHGLATNQKRCFRRGIVQYFQEDKPSPKKSLALRIVEWLLSSREKPTKSRHCCDKCDMVTSTNYMLWAKSVYH